MVKAITFDCWDTLLDDDVSRGKRRKEYFLRIFGENGFPTDEDEMNELFSREAKIFQEYIIEHRKTPDSTMRVKTIVKLADVQLKSSDVDKTAIYCDRIALDYLPPVVTGIKQVLEELSRIYKLAVICNTGWHSGETVRQLLEEYDFPKYFSHLTFSDGAGMAKPHKQIFEYTLDKLDCRTEDAVHIGDSEYSDIVGAKEANMKAILFTGINDKYKDNNSADVTISNYDNLVDIIGKM
ncbi:MAG: HAD family hydrolase [Thermodesulfovibrionales bacterium]